MTVKDICHHLESLVPLSLQESYDNSGLLVGNPSQEVTKALVALDSTQEVLEEAIAKGCEMVISHHPIVFSGLKSFTGKNYVEKVVMTAIKNNIALYAAHTNLDNVHFGVNAKIGEMLGLENCKILDPKNNLLKKLVVFVPNAEAKKLSNAMFYAGAGSIGEYDECSFASMGKGSFRGSEKSSPSLGEKGIRHYEDETRLEFLVEQHKLKTTLQAMFEAHPYEEIAYDIYTLENAHQNIGSGMIGELRTPVYTLDFLQQIKEVFGGVIRHTRITSDQIRKVAWCGGSGSFLLSKAKSAGADIFISSDFKYHQFFDAENQIIIADIGHYENEQYTKELIASILKEKFSNFAVLLSEENTNPINYI